MELIKNEIHFPEAPFVLWALPESKKVMDEKMTTFGHYLERPYFEPHKFHRVLLGMVVVLSR